MPVQFNVAQRLVCSYNTASPKNRALARIAGRRGVNEDFVSSVYFNVVEVSQTGALKVARGAGIAYGIGLIAGTLDCSGKAT